MVAHGVPKGTPTVWEALWDPHGVWGVHGISIGSPRGPQRVPLGSLCGQNEGFSSNQQLPQAVLLADAGKQQRPSTATVALSTGMADDQALTCGEFEFASCPDGQVVRRTDLARMNPWAPVFNDGLFGDCRPGLPAEDD